MTPTPRHRSLGNLGARSVQPEWLDELAPAEARAQRSRRDLRRVNLWMGNLSKVVQALNHASPRPTAGRLVELGAGDGTFLLRVARRLHRRWPKTEAVLVDRLALVSPETHQGFANLGWTVQSVQADVFDWLRSAPTGPREVILSNLFLHHFAPEPLGLLLRSAAERATLFLACEPERSLGALLGARLLGLLGCNDVTRHDALVSVRAGFQGRELSSLWRRDGGWRMTERPAGLFSHLFQADLVRGGTGPNG